MKTALALCLAVLCAVAYVYGFEFAMTADGFPIQGYIGALLPVVLVLCGAGVGAVIAS